MMYVILTSTTQAAKKGTFELRLESQKQLTQSKLFKILSSFSVFLHLQWCRICSMMVGGLTSWLVSWITYLDQNNFHGSQSIKSHLQFHSVNLLESFYFIYHLRPQVKGQNLLLIFFVSMIKCSMRL